MRWLRANPVGPAVFGCSVLILIVGQLLLPPALRHDAASTVDISGALLYLCLPLLAMFVAFGVAWVQKVHTLRTLLAVRPRAARLRGLMAMVTWAGAAPLFVAVLTVVRTQDLAVDRPLFAAVTLPQVLWMCLMTSIGYLVGSVAHRFVAPVLAGGLVLVLIVAEGGGLYPLGHSAALAGMTPTTDSWILPVVLMSGTLAGGMLVIFALPLWSSRTAILVAPMMVLIVALVGPRVPPQEFRQASAAQKCTDGPVVVCSSAAHRQWAAATSDSAGRLSQAATDHGLTLPVNAMVINAGDAKPQKRTRDGEARIYLDTRAAPVSMPVDQLAQVLVGMSCENDQGQVLAAVAAWLAASTTDTSDAFSRAWPEFAALSEADKRAAARHAFSGVECGGQ